MIRHSLHLSSISSPNGLDSEQMKPSLFTNLNQMFKLPNVWGTLWIKKMNFEDHNLIRRKENTVCYFSWVELGWGRILFIEDPQFIAHFLSGQGQGVLLNWRPGSLFTICILSLNISQEVSKIPLIVHVKIKGQFHDNIFYFCLLVLGTIFEVTSPHN